MLKSTKGITMTAVIITILVLVVIAGVGFGAYKIGENKSKENTQATNTVNNETENKSDASVIEYEKITATLSGIQGLYITSIEENNGKYLIKGVIYDEYVLTASEFEAIKNGKTIELVTSGDTKQLSYTSKNNDQNGDYLIEKNMESPLYQITYKENNYVIKVMAQLSDVRQLTDKYMEIELDGTVKIVDEDDNSVINSTVKELYDSFNYVKPVEETNPEPIYNFKFENGECTAIYQMTTRV